MAELIHLVVADDLDVDDGQQVGQVGLAGGHDAHAGAGEGDLGRAGKLPHHIAVSLLGAQAENVGEGAVVTGELMDAVGVVPHEHEVGGGGAHGGDAAQGIVAIHDAVGVGVLGHAPHTLDLGVTNQVLHHVHIRAGGGHGNGNHLHAEILADFEMAVIAGSGAQPFYLVQLAPGLGRVEIAVGIGPGDGVIHELQAGAAAYEHLLGLAVQDLGKQPLGGGNAVHVAVVSHVDAVGDKVLGPLQYAADVGD